MPQWSAEEQQQEISPDSHEKRLNEIGCPGERLEGLESSVKLVLTPRVATQGNCLRIALSEPGRCLSGANYARCFFLNLFFNFKITTCIPSSRGFDFLPALQALGAVSKEVFLLQLAADLSRTW